MPFKLISKNRNLCDTLFFTEIMEQTWLIVFILFYHLEIDGNPEYDNKFYTDLQNAFFRLKNRVQISAFGK